MATNSGTPFIVTRKELQSFLKKGREPDKLTEVVTVALQGDTKYQDNDLKWRLKADGEGGGECEVSSSSSNLDNT